MPDVVIVLDRQGRERTRHDADGLLGSANLKDLLDTDSWTDLIEALGTDAETAIEVRTLDGRVFDAVVRNGVEDLAVVLHDVTRYAEIGAQMAHLVATVSRQNHHLRTLLEATALFAESLDIPVLCQRVCEILGTYLDASRVEVRCHAQQAAWTPEPDAPTNAEPDEERPLTASRGVIGSVSWWRDFPLMPHEEETLTTLLVKVAQGLDHALLLVEPSAADLDPAIGLLTPRAARMRLAGYPRPFPLALLDVPDADADADAWAVLTEVLAPSRQRDVTAPWGPNRLLIALDRARAEDLELWLERRAAQAAARGLSPWRAGIAVVGHDGIDAAIDRAAEQLKPHPYGG